MRWNWLLVTALASGGGIWAMHFIAMLGYAIPSVAFRYDLVLTLASLGLAIGFCGLGLYLCATHGATPKSLAVAGLFTGMGVASMHYTGMAALEFPGTISYEPMLFGASLAIAIAAATAALWLCFNTRSLRLRLLSAAIMAFAVCGMHYTGMAATHIVCRTPGTGLLVGSNTMLGIDAHNLAYAIGILVTLLLSGSMLAAAVDERVAGTISALRGELSSNVQLLGSLFKTIPAAVIAVDGQMRIRAFNGRAEAIFGASEQEVLGRDIEGFIPARFHLAHRTADERFAHGNVTTLNMDGRSEIFGLRANGEEFPATVAVSKAGGPQGPVYTIVLKDISREKAASAELKAARDAAEAAAVEKSRFLANISHEVRTPLNGIVGLMQILETSDVSREVGDCLKLMRASAQQLLGLFNDIFDIAKIDAGTLKLRLADFDAGQLAAETVADHSAAAKSRGIDLKLVCDADGRVLCHADPVRTRQILSNLVGNAVKFTDYGEVRVEVIRTADAIRYAVSDTGPGIAPEHLDHIFDRFYQIDSSNKRAHEGAGLGLAICRELTGRMAGTLTVTSVVGEGSTFTLSLPKGAEASASSEREAAA
jgi:PAS domain S-box-containing protein